MLLVVTAVCRARGSVLPVERGLLAEGDRDDLLEVTVVKTASGRRSSWSRHVFTILRHVELPEVASPQRALRRQRRDEAGRALL